MNCWYPFRISLSRCPSSSNVLRSKKMQWSMSSAVAGSFFFALTTAIMGMGNGRRLRAERNDKRLRDIFRNVMRDELFKLYGAFLYQQILYGFAGQFLRPTVAQGLKQLGIDLLNRLRATVDRDKTGVATLDKVVVQKIPVVLVCRMNLYIRRGGPCRLQG